MGEAQLNTVCTVYMYQTRVSFIRGENWTIRIFFFGGGGGGGGGRLQAPEGHSLGRSGGMPPDNFGFFSLLRLILVCIMKC